MPFISKAKSAKHEVLVIIKFTLKKNYTQISWLLSVYNYYHRYHLEIKFRFSQCTQLYVSTIRFLVKIPEVRDGCQSNQFWQNLNRLGPLFQSLVPFHNKKVKRPCSGIKSCILVCQHMDSLVFLNSKTLFPIS